MNEQINHYGLINWNEDEEEGGYYYSNSIRLS